MIKIYEYLSKYDNNSANQIYYGMELFSNSFDDGLAFLQREIQSKAQLGDYDAIDEINGICKQIKRIKNGMNQLLDQMAKEKKPDAFDEEYDIIDENENIDYSQCLVNTNDRHSLDEDFEYKRPCGFLLNGKRYNADNWQEMLISVCSELAKLNRSLLESFVISLDFKGKKINYFGKRHVHGKNKKIPGTDIYVWINLSANAIKNLIRKILVAFGIKPSVFFVFFRADYSQLHMDNFVISDPGKTDSNSNDMKIGKYVRCKLQELADRKYHFSNEELSVLLDKDKTKTTFGIRLPFFKKVDITSNLDIQRKDHTGNYRYWKDVYYFNEQYFLVCSQWFEYNRVKFESWLEKLEK